MFYLTVIPLESGRNKLKCSCLYKFYKCVSILCINVLSCRIIFTFRNLPEFFSDGNPKTSFSPVKTYYVHWTCIILDVLATCAVHIGGNDFRVSSELQ